MNVSYSLHANKFQVISPNFPKQAALISPDYNWLIVLGFNDTSTPVGHLCRLPEKREKREEIVEEMKERDREGRAKGMKRKKQKK